MSPTHGLASTYRSSFACRCDACTEAHAERHRAENVARRQRLSDLADDAHGKQSTYINWGCRCGPCTEANTRVCAAWKTRPRESA